MQWLTTVRAGPNKKVDEKINCVHFALRLTPQAGVCKVEHGLIHNPF